MWLPVGADVGEAAAARPSGELPGPSRSACAKGRRVCMGSKPTSGTGEAVR